MVLCKKNLTTPDWRRALRWGVIFALTHRIILQIWMAIVWYIIGEKMLNLPEVQRETGVDSLPPPMDSLAGRMFLDVWRRWDAQHYMTIAKDGYSEGVSVFYPLYPFLTRLFDVVLPGGEVIAGLVVNTIALTIALTLFYVLVMHFFHDERLALWAMAAWLLYPSSYVLAGLLSESIFAALAIGCIVSQLHHKWVLSAIIGAGATLTRLQGIVLLAPLGWVVLETAWQEKETWRDRLVFTIIRATPLLLIPLGLSIFFLWRDSQNYASINELLAKNNYIQTYFPIEGFWIEIKSAFKHSDYSFFLDFLGIFFTGAILLVMTIREKYRIPVLLWYGWGYWITIGTKVNYYPDAGPPSIQSGLRYSTIIFPVFIFLGIQIVSWGKWWRLSYLTLMIILLVIGSGMTALGAWLA